MKRWSILALIAIFALLMPVSTAGVSAQDELSLSKSADLTSAALGDTITYTYTITNTDNVTIENIYLEDDELTCQARWSIQPTSQVPTRTATPSPLVLQLQST